MEWIIISLQWYLPIFILGIVFFPLTRKIFKNFSFDFGYPFAKVLAILFVSYAVYVLGTLKILPFTRVSLLLIVIIFSLINLIIIKKQWDNGTMKQLSSVIFEELLFLASFLFWTYIRGQEPSIHSLEKFMDFGFINSILRSQFFPPADIWYAGFPINYYYFGHLTGATLIKLINIKSTIGYNLLLSTIFALGVTQVFSFVSNIINLSFLRKQESRQNGSRIKYGMTLRVIFFGLIGAFIINLGGNLHTIYLFTTGYPNENPVPFWQILSGFNPTKYWYPNATRFIPLTIHEFPSYSYVVADLHGHVFDIPFVLLTLAILFVFFIKYSVIARSKTTKQSHSSRLPRSLRSLAMTSEIIFLGFLTAAHYMTNAFDGPIYLLLTIVVFLIVFQLSFRFIINLIFLISSFLIFSLPFSSHFKPFVAGIGVNCGSQFFFSYVGKIGPFLFEKGNCQISPFWMLFILWGFFWISFILFILIRHSGERSDSRIDSGQARMTNNFIFLLFSFGTLLVLIPEFFYIKDIYPAHFRANTMFKLGYQAFIMMGVASTYVFFAINQQRKKLFFIFYFLFFIFVMIYPFFSIPSYYGSLNRPVDLDGSNWLAATYSEDKEIIDYLNNNEKEQPVIVEAQGDSYTDFERISSMTGLPTVAGWWVHEWLWRGSSNIIAQRIPDVVTLYESQNIEKTKELIKKYNIKYIVVSKMEKQKYSNLYEDKFLTIGRLLFRSNNGFGALYQVD